MKLIYELEDGSIHEVTDVDVTMIQIFADTSPRIEASSEDGYSINIKEIKN